MTSRVPPINPRRDFESRMTVAASPADFYLLVDLLEDYQQGSRLRGESPPRAARAWVTRILRQLEDHNDRQASRD